MNAQEEPMKNPHRSQIRIRSASEEIRSAVQEIEPAVQEIEPAVQVS